METKFNLIFVLLITAIMTACVGMVVDLPILTLLGGFTAGYCLRTLDEWE